jgi:hypothetical protein
MQRILNLPGLPGLPGQNSIFGGVPAGGVCRDRVGVYKPLEGLYPPQSRQSLPGTCFDEIKGKRAANLSRQTGARR